VRTGWYLLPADQPSFTPIAPAQRNHDVMLCVLSVRAG